MSTQAATTDRIDRGHPTGYFVLGDALRGLACLVVVVNHVAIAVAAKFADDLGSVGQVTLRFGAPLIYMFFALSGYLVGGPWVRAWLGDRRRPHVPRYLSRRLRRLLPAFWLIIAFRLIDPLNLGYGDFGLSDLQIVGSFFALQTFYGAEHQAIMPQGWTVNIETFYYLFIPLVFVLGAKLSSVAAASRETKRRLLVGFLVAWSVLGLLLRFSVEPDSALGHSLLSLGWAFSPGMIAAAYETELRERLPQLGGLGKRIGLALIAMAFVADGLVIGFELNDGRVAAELLHFVCGTGFLVGGLVYEWSGATVHRAFDNRPVHAIGRWSYGVYLIHITVGQYVIIHAPDDYGPHKLLAYVAVVTMAVTLALAALMWRYWEEPWLEGYLPWKRPRHTPEAEVRDPASAPGV